MTSAKLKILFLVEAAGGGTGRHVMDLADGLVARGQDVHLLYSPVRADGVFTERVRNARPGITIQPLQMERSIHPVHDGKALWEIRKYVEEHGPFDILHGHSSKAGALARLLRVISKGVQHVVYTPHAFITLSPGISAVKRQLFTRVERALGRHFSDAVITVSQDEADHGVRLGIPLSKLHCIPNGIAISGTDTHVTDRHEWRRQHGIYPGDVIVGFVGRLDFQKAPEVLLRAFQALKETSRTHLLFVGDGPKRPELAAEIATQGLNDRVQLLGFQRNVTHLLSMFDIFVLPSRYEGLPYALLEAMAAGLPVIATSVTGNRELIRSGENGYLVPPDSSEELSGALQMLVDSADVRARMGKASMQAIVQEFSLDKMVDATLNVYRAL